MLDLARVVATHPEANAVDLVFLATGQQVAGVQVMGGSAGAAHGFHDLPQPLEQDTMPSDPFSAIGQAGDARMTLAVVAYFRELPVVMGFLYPQVSQCLFADRDRMVYRHASDVYFTIDGAGNTELSHPSGVYLRIGEDPAHQDLTGLDYDRRWKIERNTGRQPHLHLHLPNTDVHADPAGNLTVTHAGNLSLTTGGGAAVAITGAADVSVGGNATVEVGGSTTVTSTGPAHLVAPTVQIDAAATTVTGSLQVVGPFSFLSGMSGRVSGVGATATIVGDVNVTGGHVTNNGIVLDTHHHHAPNGDTGGPIS